MLASYPDLLTAIPKWAWRTGDDDFEAAVPDLIALCEARTNRTLRLKEQETVAAVPLTSGVGELPSDFLEYRTIGDGQRGVGLVSPSFAADYYGPSSSDTAFTLVGDEIRSYSVGHPSLTMTYYAAIPPLSIASPTNWLLTKAPDVYLYGSLMEAAPFMMDDQRLATWGTLYDKAITDLKSADVMARYANGRVRVRSATP